MQAKFGYVVPKEPEEVPVQVGKTLEKEQKKKPAKEYKF